MHALARATCAAAGTVVVLKEHCWGPKVAEKHSRGGCETDSVTVVWDVRPYALLTARASRAHPIQSGGGPEAPKGG